MYRLLLLCILLSVHSAAAQVTTQPRADWNKPFQPFKIIGNVYYVGMAGVSSFFITSDQGHILIDGGLPESAGPIAQHIADLGFNIKEVKYLLNSHAHFDHSGGLAELKKISGAQLVASEGDRQALVTGSRDDDPSYFFPPVQVDRIIRDGDTVQAGQITLTARLTPGHTKGATTWTMTTSDGGKNYNVVFYSSSTVAANRLNKNPTYPGIVSDYQQTFRKARTLPCDVFLAPHGNFFSLPEKVARMRAGGKNPFIDPSELKRFINASERDFQRELKQQKAAAK